MTLTDTNSVDVDVIPMQTCGVPTKTPYQNPFTRLLVMTRECFMLFVFVCIVVNIWSTPSSPSLPTPTTIKIKITITPKFGFGTLTWIRLIISSVVFVIWNLHILSLLSKFFHSVSYSPSLNIIFHKKHASNHCHISLHFSAIMSLLLLDPLEYLNVLPSIFLITDASDFPSINLQWLSRSLKVHTFNANSVVFLATSFSQATHILCIFVLTLFYTRHFRKITLWYFALILLLSADIEKNPGPNSFTSNYLTFMNWNLNSLAKDNFSKTHLIEAHNSIYNYDIISLCETSLTEETTPQVPNMEGYTYEPANHPDDTPRGGVGVYFKDSLPVVVRRDLSFNES